MKSCNLPSVTLRARPATIAARSLMLCLCVAATAIVALTLWPAPLFAYGTRSSTIILHSDAPIPPEVAGVLDDVERRLAVSHLPVAGPYHVYICNDAWKLRLFGRSYSTGFGGIADVYLTRNIFIRPSDIARNAVLPPASWRFPLTDRPLSYFIAHEITHVQQMSALGLWRYWQTPGWLLEGYADHVGKGRDFDLERNLAALQADAPQMHPASGVYNRYQLAVELLLKHTDFLELAADPPDPEEVLRDFATGKAN